MLTEKGLLVGRFHGSMAALKFSQIAPVLVQVKESNA